MFSIPCYTLLMLGDDRPLRETDDTFVSAAQDRLEEILRKVKAAGGEMKSDETVPLYVDFNNDIVEVGISRIVAFNINETDFEITHQVKNYHTVGAGHRKALERLARPIIELKLKKKPETSDQWTGVDLDDLF
ncbi:hypothetical protein HYV58_01695 [Candidatus Peregrinibacteria bacterium]|nr:hypothetical protein [Candidatus Peregrinibacteria bacterium]